MPEALQDLSWFLAKIIYGLIPDVYAIFEFFAKQEFFTRGELANLWNNLYVVMSVLVLFAIGIKLISAIVNPDALDGKDSPKKKNAKRSFFDAIIAVFLIILIPMGFSLLTSLQTELIESKFIQKYIFGITFTAESQSSVGQLLAYQTLSAFLYPCTDTDGTCNPEDGQNAMNALSWDIKKMGLYIKSEDLKSDALNDGAWHSNTVVYHPVLGLVAGGLVLYQVVLMALDMALRSAKLALLELMLPIILGAFIFDREILTKWVKEFISTYLGAFLKLIAVTMMVLGLSRINIFFESFENSMSKEVVDNNVAKGLLRLILMMGILRLVKEVPNIINKIFGTNIQYQGGIKGRLGQMAGVGGLAQKAWTALGTGAKNLGKATLGAVPAAAGYLGNKIYKAKTGRNLTDTRAIRGIRAAGAGIGSAWKTGSVLKAVEAGNKAFDSTPATKLDLMNRAQMVDKALDGITKDKDGNTFAGQTNIANKRTAIRGLDSGIRSIAGLDVAAANRTLQARTQAQSLAQTMSKNFNNILDMNESAARAAEERGDYNAAKNIRGINEKFRALGVKGDTGLVDSQGNKITGWDAMFDFINNNQDLYDQQVVDNLIGDNGKLRSLGRQYEYAEAHQSDLGLTNDDVSNFGRGEAAVSFLANNTLKGKVDGAKASYDRAVESARPSDSDKLALDKYVAEYSDLTNSMAFGIGRKRSESGLSSSKYDTAAQITSVDDSDDYSESEPTSGGGYSSSGGGYSSSGGGYSSSSGGGDSSSSGGLFESSGSNAYGSGGDTSTASTNFWNRATSGIVPPDPSPSTDTSSSDDSYIEEELAKLSASEAKRPLTRAEKNRKAQLEAARDNGGSSDE